LIPNRAGPAALRPCLAAPRIFARWRGEIWQELQVAAVARLHPVENKPEEFAKRMKIEVQK
jgi:hypothetical protein